jgi:glutamyl-tRNA reductase
MEIVLVGLNHRTATVEMRERVAFNPQQARRAADELRSQGILEETLVLSTCNRSELYGVPPETAPDSARAMESFLASFHQLSPAELNGCLYRHRDSEAVRHLFRVAAGLDSMLLGEAEILGQVREAYRIALEHGATGPVLNRMFQGALEVGKRVRAETAIGTRPMSIALAGVKLAERIFGNLRGHKALIIGAGTMGEQVVGYIRDRGIARVLVANRSRERAEELAHRVRGEVVDWEGVPRALEVPDMIVSSVAGTDPVLTRPLVERAMAVRSNRALFIIDLGVPRNVESQVGGLYNVYLYNIDDLTEIVDHNKKAREEEIPRAEAIVEEHVAKFEAWQASVHAVTLLNQLRAKLHQQRDEFVRERLAQMPQLSSEERQKVGKLTEELLDRILLEPAERVRSARQLRRKIQNLEALRDVFGLTREKP